MPVELEALGWTPDLAGHFAPHAAAGLVPARVSVEHRARYDLYTETGDVEAALAGRMRHEARGRLELPAVGDWVALDPPAAAGASGTIRGLLPRRSLFTRKAAGREHQEQIVAANVDVVFIVTSLNAELSPRRLERYLALAWESGAAPAIVLSKADLARDAEVARAEVEAVSPGVPVLVTSASKGMGVGSLLEFLRGHRTGALLGSSGVGKSSLINALLGEDRLATGAIRTADDRGRHTTTRRELVLLPGGGLLIDTPGMRELQLADAGHGLLAAFDDVEALAAECGFRDCTHGPEPDCAVKGAVTAGRIDAERLASWHKLRRELAHHERDTDHGKAAQAKAFEKVMDRSLQKRLRDKRG